MAIRHRTGGGVLRFDDTITLYRKEITTTQVEGIQTETATWNRKVITGVQWSDKYEKNESNGKVSIARYAKITFPEGTYDNIELSPAREEDAIVYGEVIDTVTEARGSRLSDLLEKYPRSGRIKSVNDNTNRRLPNIKVVVS